MRADNPAALASYLAQGFAVVGTARQYAKIDGLFVDEILIEKFLPVGGTVAPLIVLTVVTFAARALGQAGVTHLRDWAASVRVGLAVMFGFTAAAHFNSMRADMIAMVPPLVPNPAFMVTFTGVCEVLGAIGLLVPRTRRLAAVGLILLLVSVLPANTYAAQAGVTLRGAPPTPLLPRMALQVLFIALVWWAGVRRQR